MKVYDQLLAVAAQNRAGYLVLLDPDRATPAGAAAWANHCSENGADAILIGSSLLFSDQFGEIVQAVKKNTPLPVLLFPGAVNQLSPHADAILFLSLISGRNPHYLIDNQVLAAPLIQKMGLEPIPTAYMLVESGQTTSVAFMSNTRPLPRDKPEIAAAHALAGEYLGMKLLFLEAGSGANRPVSNQMIAAVRQTTSLPLIVGGGIRCPQVAAEKVAAGAQFVVTGSVLEQDLDPLLIRDFAAAIHGIPG